MAGQHIPSSGDSRVDAALARIRGKFTDLEDAMVVQAHLEKAMAAQMRNHARVIEDHDAWQQNHDKLHDRLAKEAAERGRVLDERIAGLVSGIGEFISRIDKLTQKIDSLPWPASRV